MQLIYCGSSTQMYQKDKTSRPSTANADGTFNVMVELRAAASPHDASVARALPEQSLPAGCTVDEEFEAVPMAGGTTIIRCKVTSQADIDALKGQPGVVAVWNDTPIEPMTPR